jgi:hypothetical protein
VESIFITRTFVAMLLAKDYIDNMDRFVNAFAKDWHE